MNRSLRFVCVLLLACHHGADAAKKKKKKKAAEPAKEEPTEPTGPFTLTSPSFLDGGEFPEDNRGDGDNISPKLAWTNAPKNTASFVLIVDSEELSKKEGETKQKTHWTIYDIPKEVSELRDELSGSGASDVPRLGMKDDAGQAPVVVDPMGQIDGWVDPEIEAMQKMIHGALDASFEERNRAKEGKTSFGSNYYKGPSKKGSTTTFKLYALSGRLDHLRRGAGKEEIVKAMKGKVLGKASLSATI